MTQSIYKPAAFVCGMALIGAAAVNPAHAEGLYISGFAGGNYVPESDVGSGAEAEFSFGYVGGGAIGYAGEGGGLFELEGAYAANDVDSATIPGTTVTATGDLTVASIMLNGIYQFDAGSGFTPYIGLGLGAAMYSLDASFVAGGSTVAVDDEEWVGASQVLLGIGYDVSEEVNISLGYRFFVPWSEPEFDATIQPGGTSGTTSVDHSSHAAVINLRISFN